MAVEAARILFMVAILNATPAIAAQMRGESSAPTGGLEEMLLEVDINQQHLDDTVSVLRASNGEIYVSRDNLERWRLRAPEDGTIERQGISYRRLHAIANLTYALDLGRQAMSISAPAEAFIASSFSDSSTRLRASRPTPGAFVNADLLAEHSGGLTTGNALFELGLFNAFGVATSNFLFADTAGKRTHIRLDTVWTTDLPDRLMSIRLGDAISRAGMWGHSLRFGGIQIATNFAVQPGLVTMPMQGISGQAVLPSTVDVYVNNALTSSREVAPGPFSIANVPVVTGQGNVRVVVRDVLGREQVISQPFYAVATLLAAGRNDFSYELGTIRRNYGLASNDYGNGFVSGTHRLGLSDRFTVEMRAEAEERLRVVGAGGVWLLPSLGIVSGALASSSGEKSGRHAVVGLDRMADGWSAGMQAQASTIHYSELGVDRTMPMPRRQASAHVGIALPGDSVVGLAGILSDVPGQAPVRILSLNYSRQVDKFGFIGLSLSRTLSAAGNAGASITWSIPLGERTSAMASMSRQGAQKDAFIQVQQGLPVDKGYGYLLQLGQNGQRRIGLAAQSSVGTLTADAATNHGETGERLGFSGALVFLNGMHASRQITDSFAMLTLPDLPNVQVYTDNQPAGRTDTDGNVLLPRLRAYERNAISIDAADLPFDAKAPSLSIDVVPPYRSGLAVRFPVSRERGATLTLHLDDGKAMPAGSIAKVDEKDESFPVGHGGVLYVTGLSERNHLRVTWRGQTCEIMLAYKASRDNPLPDLGEFLCSGVRP